MLQIGVAEIDIVLNISSYLLGHIFINFLFQATVVILIVTASVIKAHPFGKTILIAGKIVRALEKNIPLRP